LLLNKISKRFGDDDDATQPRLRRKWTEPGFDPERDTVIEVDSADGIIGYADYFNNSDPFVLSFAYVAIDRDHAD
jgi:hypothetical protein